MTTPLLDGIRKEAAPRAYPITQEDDQARANSPWEASAYKDHDDIIRKIREAHGTDLHSVALKVLPNPVYDDGRDATVKYNDTSLGSAAGKAKDPFYTIRTRPEFERVLRNYGWTDSRMTEENISRMRREIQAHELLHFVEKKMKEKERRRYLHQISTSGFETDYTKLYPVEKEKIVEYLTQQLLSEERKAK